MSAGILLIDGYNLMHAAGMGRHDYKPGELLQCRTKLLRFLLNKLSAAEVRTTTIVFDARDPPPDRPAQVVISGLKVLFANPSGDADVVIQEWLSRHSSPSRVTLVSSDRVLQRAARGCRSKFVGSEEFLHELDRRRGSRSHSHATGADSSGTDSTGAGSKRPARLDDAKPAAQLSASQTAYWLKVFGDVPFDAAMATAEDETRATGRMPQTRAQPKPAAPSGPAASPASTSQSNGPKPVGKDAADDLKYWLQVFGDSSSASTGASSEELRLADLENWLKDFQSKETSQLRDGGRRRG